MPTSNKIIHVDLLTPQCPQTFLAQNKLAQVHKQAVAILRDASYSDTIHVVVDKSNDYT